MKDGKKVDNFNFISRHDADNNVIVDILNVKKEVFGPTAEYSVKKGNIKEATEALEDIAKILGVSVTVGERKYAGDPD